MKLRSLFLTLAVSLALSSGLFSLSRAPEQANAGDPVDVGNVTIGSIFDSASNNFQVYLIPTEENALPNNWGDQYRYHPVGSNDGAFINGTKDSGAYIKHAEKLNGYVSFYLELSQHVAVDTILTVQGTWTSTGSGTTYTFTFEPFTRKWNGSIWAENFNLDVYDKISLLDTGFDDQDRVAFDNTALSPNSWNTFIPSVENTRKSFAFEFAFEAYGNMTSTLNIRVGTSGPYEEGHHYKIDLNNTWGPKPGVIVFSEYVGTTQIYRSADINCKLSAGQRHIIEFGSVYLVDSDDTCNYLVYDGEPLYQERRTPASHERSTKVSYYYGGTNIFLGTTSTTQKAQDQVIKFDHFDAEKRGIYLDAGQNSIPSGWSVGGAPLTKNNVLRNGKPLFDYGTSTYPITKCGSDEENSYYLNLSALGKTINDGDYLTLCDEFRFYVNGTTYTMSVIPISFLYKDGKVTEIEDTNRYLLNKVKTYNIREYYDDTGLSTIDSIIAIAQPDMLSNISMRELWDLYFSVLEQLDAVPLSDARQQEILDEIRADAIAQLEVYLDSSIYDEDNLAIVQGLVDPAVTFINNSTDSVEINNKVTETITSINSSAKNRLTVAEEKLLSEATLQTAYLEPFDVVTTTDLCAVGDVYVRAEEEDCYRTGGFQDPNCRIATSSNNLDGNMIFKFKYESSNPSSSKYGSQFYIRLRGNSDRNAYRFDIGTQTGSTQYGVGLCTFVNDIAVNRELYNADFAANTSYEIECGAIDIAGYDRTFIFIRIGGNFVLRQVVDSLDNQQPTIRILDSLTKDDEWAKLSPSEEGTTKSNNSRLLGRYILDPSSNKDNLYVTLSDNAIGSSTTLYPYEKNAFTINGNEVDSNLASTTLLKVDSNKYKVIFDNASLNDNDEVHIGGCYASFNSAELTKSIYEFFGTEFVYHESTNSWSQELPTDRATIVSEAKTTLNKRAIMSEYSDANQQAINNIITEYSNAIDAAETQEIPGILEEGLRKIDEIPTVLLEMRNAAKNELSSYRSLDLYRKEEQSELQQILADAYSSIDALTEQSAMDEIVLEAKAKIDGLKTAEKRNEEDLSAKKKSANAEVQTIVGLLDFDRYTEENTETLKQLTYKVIEDIKDATTEEEVDSILNKYKTAIKNIETTDGTHFDGEKYASDEEPTKQNKNLGIIIGASVGGAVLLAGGATLTILLLKKKRRKGNEKD